ncbi:MAG: hypothetical protein WBA68_10155 [Alteraurantiacibacter sp.]
MATKFQERAMARAKARDSELQSHIVFVSNQCLAPFARLRGAMPKSYFGKPYENWLKNQRDVTATVTHRLREIGATVRESSVGVEIVLGGIKARSTMGLSGALMNWRDRAIGKRRR